MNEINSKNYKKVIKAFKAGQNCYFCNWFNNPISCDMCRDEDCKTTFISKILFAIKIFIHEIKKEVENAQFCKEWEK